MIKKAKIYHEDKPYGCGLCEKRYKSYPAFYTHIKSIHKTKKPPAGSKFPKKVKCKQGRPQN